MGPQRAVSKSSCYLVLGKERLGNSMRFSSNVTITWVNGWSVEIQAGGLTKISIMGPRQVFYSLYHRGGVDKSVVEVQAEADQVWHHVEDSRLLAILAAMNDMPSRPLITPCGLVVKQKQEEYDRNASAAWEILNGRQVEKPSYEPLVLDDSDNRFNSLQS